MILSNIHKYIHIKINDVLFQKSAGLYDPLASCLPTATLFIILTASCAVKLDPVMFAGTPISSRKPTASARYRLNIYERLNINNYTYED